MTTRAALAVLLVLLHAACGKVATIAAKPQEPGPDAIGFYCRMTLAEHQGPKGQVLLKGWKDPLWFSSVRDALTYAQGEVVSDNEIAGKDLAQGRRENPAPGSWIEAKAAHYVVGSTKSSGMGGVETVPFRNRDAAEAFAKQYGGSVTDYASALRSVAKQDDAGGGGT